VYHDYGGNGGGNGRGHVVTSAMVSLAVGVLVAGIGWLGFTRGEIDRAMVPMRDRMAGLESAHGRLDNMVSNEILRLNRDKVDNSTRLEMLAALNLRLSTLEKQLEQSSERDHIVLQQLTDGASRLNELRQRVWALEGRRGVSAPEDVGPP
jgi:hypothetical protein